MMWDLIEQNRKKSKMLFVGMAILLVLLGYFIGEAFSQDGGGLVGIPVAVGIWIFLTLLALNNGDSILLRVAGAKEVTKDLNPRLFNVVEEMKIAAGLPAMPRVYIIDEAAPNAFAIGVKPEKSAVAVTAGLLERLNRDELQGVVAHECGHILNRDSQLMTVAGIMLGSIVLLSHFFLRSWWFLPSGGGSRRYRKSGGGGGSPQLQLIMIAVALVLAILGPIFARLLYLAISRKREYLADATAVQLTRYPEGLASALEKISSASIPMESANKVTAPMYIVNPLESAARKLSSLDSTHPPVEERIKILRRMSGGADLREYEKAYASISGKQAPLIASATLHKSKHIDIRDPDPVQEPPKTHQKTKRDVMDLLRAVNDYAFIVCACGLKMKLPADVAPDTTVKCPRCGRTNKVPVAEVAAVAAAVGATTTSGSASPPPGVSASPSGHLQYKRRGHGWETFSCQCGRLLQLSPAFEGSQLKCHSCHRIIDIR